MKKFIFSLLAIFVILISSVEAQTPTNHVTVTYHQVSCNTMLVVLVSDSVLTAVQTTYDTINNKDRYNTPNFTNIHVDSIYYVLGGWAEYSDTLNLYYLDSFDIGGGEKAYGNVSIEIIIQIKKVNSSFTTERDTVYVGDTVSFNYNSTIYNLCQSNYTNTHVWRIDGLLSDSVHVFSDTGTYTVSLTDTLTNGQLFASETYSKTIVVLDTTTHITTTNIPLTQIDNNIHIFSLNKEITIRSDRDIKQVNVYNTIGQMITSNESVNGDNRSESINLSRLQSGIYIVVVVDDRNVATTRKLLLN